MESFTSTHGAPRALVELERGDQELSNKKKVYQNRTIIKEVSSKNVNQFAQLVCTTSLHIARALHKHSWSSTSARQVAQALMKLKKGRSGAFKQKKVFQNRTIIKEVTSKNVNQFAHS